VRDFPYMWCETFDRRGKAQPLPETFVDPDIARKDELSAQSVRKRKILATLRFVALLPLFWSDSRSGGYLVLLTVLGLTMILAGLRLLYWITARKLRLQEGEQGVRAHLARETRNDQCRKSVR